MNPKAPVDSDQLYSGLIQDKALVVMERVSEKEALAILHGGGIVLNMKKENLNSTGQPISNGSAHKKNQFMAVSSDNGKLFIDNAGASGWTSADGPFGTFKPMPLAEMTRANRLPGQATFADGILEKLFKIRAADGENDTQPSQHPKFRQH